MMNAGLVLEGGGMRGLFTSGVLDYLMEEEVWFPYVIGASFGAINGVSYISGQAGRTRRFILNNVNNPEYMGWKNMIKERSYFGIKYGYYDIPLKLDPFDFDVYFRSLSDMVITVTNCSTGEAEYFHKKSTDNNSVIEIIRASGSLPFIAPEVVINEKIYMDGGIADSIPLKKAQKDGMKRNIVVLTRDLSYRKEPFKLGIPAKIIYRKYPKFISALENRHKMYNETIEYIIEEEKRGNVFVIRPEQPVEIKRIEKNTTKLQELYESGYNQMKRIMPELRNWLNK